MPPSIAALIIAVFGIALGAIAAPPSLGRAHVMRIAGLWALFAFIAFIVPFRLAGLAAIMAVLAATAPREPGARAAFFLAMAPALPVFYVAKVPFPGINFLIDLDYGLAAIFVILGPILLMKTDKQGARPFVLTTAAVVGFAVFTSVMTARTLPITSVLRELVTNVSVIGLIYLGLSRALRTREDVDKALDALTLSIILIAGVGVFTFLRSWNIYSELAVGEGFNRFADYRSGNLRIQSTLMTTLLGYMMAVGCMLVYRLHRQQRIAALHRYGLYGLFLVVLFLTGARGVYIVAILLFACYFAYRSAPRVMRMISFPALWAGLIIGFIGIQSGRTTAFTGIDEYGTFEYRIELLRASFKQISRAPLFGSEEYQDSPLFAHLVQGQGIIDFVNTYLIITLEFGLIALVLFLFPFFSVLRALSARAAGASAARKNDEGVDVELTAGALVMALWMYLLMMMSVSDTSYLIHYAFVFLALGKAYASLGPTGEVAGSDGPAGGAS